MVSFSRMVLPNLAFDALMFGLLLLAAALDSAFPFLQGTASLLVVGGATYWAAQELSEALLRRVGWTQESLSTSVALCTGGFLYFWLRNDSDLALLGLSIGLMMSALMVAISILAALGAIAKEGTVTPVLGWFSAFGASLFLGATAGVLSIGLGVPSTEALPLKFGGIIAALVLWKLREKLAPPPVNAHFQETHSHDGATSPALSPQRVALFPQRGTLLDRLFPLLVSGILLLALLKSGPRISFPSSPAVAASDNGDAH